MALRVCAFLMHLFIEQKTRNVGEKIKIGKHHNKTDIYKLPMWATHVSLLIGILIDAHLNKDYLC